MARSYRITDLSLSVWTAPRTTETLILEITIAKHVHAGSLLQKEDPVPTVRLTKSPQVERVVIIARPVLKWERTCVVVFLVKLETTRLMESTASNAQRELSLKMEPHTVLSAPLELNQTTFSTPSQGPAHLALLGPFPMVTVSVKTVLMELSQKQEPVNVTPVHAATSLTLPLHRLAAQLVQTELTRIPILPNAILVRPTNMQLDLPVDASIVALEMNPMRHKVDAYLARLAFTLTERLSAKHVPLLLYQEQGLPPVINAPLVRKCTLPPVLHHAFHAASIMCLLMVYHVYPVQWEHMLIHMEHLVCLVLQEPILMRHLSLSPPAVSRVHLAITHQIQILILVLLVLKGPSPMFKVQSSALRVLVVTTAQVLQEAVQFALLDNSAIMAKAVLPALQILILIQGRVNVSHAVLGLKS